MAIEFGKESKIGVVGAGAIGGITAALLCRAGYKIELACHSQQLAHKICSEGLHISGLRGDFRVTLPAVAHISQFSGTKDIMLLATKSNDMLTAAGEMLPFLDAGSKVVCMQNGIAEFVVAEVIGAERTVGCIVGWGATMHDAGELELTAEGEFMLGNVFDADDPSLSPLSKIMASAFPTRISRNMLGHRYAKLVINACIAPLGAICGLTFGELLADRKIRNIMIAIVRECMSVADAMSIKVEPVIGQVDYYKFLRGSNFLASSKRHLLLRMMGLRYHRARSSSLTSLIRGKRTEIDYLNGYVVIKGKEYNIPTPVNNCVVKLVKDIEDGRRQISRANLQNPVFEQF